MANSYYNFSPSFVPNTKVRSDEVNAQYSSLEAAFDLLPTVPGSIVAGTSWLGVESGSGNAYAVTMPNTRTSNAEGDRVLFKATHTNTGAATLNVDGLGALSIVQADGSAILAGDLLTGMYYEVVYSLSSNHYQLQGPTAGILSGVEWAQEWAVKAEDSLISTAAGGNGVSDYSALHWAAKAADYAILTAADAAATAADAAATAADVISTNADAASTAADALATAADAVSTAADAAATAQDAIDTAADAAATAADAISTAADAAATAQDAIDTAADAASTAADVISTAATYDLFDDRMLGSKSADPAVDNDGDPLVEGTLYWNSVNKTLRSYNGTSWQDVGSSTANITTYTATASQTTFSGLDDNSIVLSYTVGYLQVYLNGVLLKDTTEYTATDGTSVVLATGATAGDILQCFGFGTFDISTSYTTTESDARYAQVTNNLSDLASAATARTNLEIPVAHSSKNLIQNGGFSIHQRAASASHGPGTYNYNIDRWSNSNDMSTATWSSNQQQIARTDTDAPLSYYTELSCTVADASPGASETAGYQHSINSREGWVLRIGTAKAKTVTLSFWHAHSQTGTWSVAFRNVTSPVSRHYVAEYTQSVADTWEKSTITLTLDTDTSASWGNVYPEDTKYLAVSFCLDTNATYGTSTLNTWATGNKTGSTNNNNFFSSTSNRFRLADVQLELGSNATDFEYFGGSTFTDYQACQQYLQRISGGACAVGYATATTVAGLKVSTAVQMRGSNPTLEYLSGSVTTLRIKGGGSSIACTSEGTHWVVTGGVDLYLSVASGLTTSDIYALDDNGAVALINSEF
jgi:hypothetical protein